MPVIGTFSGRQGRLCRHHPHAHPEHQGAHRRQRPQGGPTARPTSASWRAPPRSAPPGARPSRAREETYLRVKLDDPALPQPIWGALLEATEDGVARLSGGATGRTTALTPRSSSQRAASQSAAPSGEQPLYCRSHPVSRSRLIACVLLPFAAGYYLSYLFRTINALIAGDLTAELGLERRRSRAA